MSSFLIAFSFCDLHVGFCHYDQNTQIQILSEMKSHPHINILEIPEWYNIMYSHLLVL